MSKSKKFVRLPITNEYMEEILPSLQNLLTSCIGDVGLEPIISTAEGLIDEIKFLGKKIQIQLKVTKDEGEFLD